MSRKKSIWKNKIFTYVIIPLFVTITGGLIILLVVSDNPENMIEYNVESKDQKGGVTAANIENVYIENGTESKDEILCRSSQTHLNLFLTNFRMILYSYYWENDFYGPYNVDWVFKASSFFAKEEESEPIIMEAIDDTLVINAIFSYFDFNSHTGVRFVDAKPKVQINESLGFFFYLPSSIEFRDGDTLTGYVWFTGELMDLRARCKELLTNYGSVGDATIIDDIVRLNNHIDNVIKGERHTRLPVYDEDMELIAIKYFFEKFKGSYFLCNERILTLKS